MSYQVVADRQTDFRATPLPPEAAYELAMGADEASIQRGFTIYNARHPRP